MPAATSSDLSPPRQQATITASWPCRDYDLETTLNSGQAFRWISTAEGWEGVLQGRWTRIAIRQDRLLAETVEPVEDWTWLTHYLALEEPFDDILASFPPDPPLRAAVAACRGLRLLRQEPWECLASFLLSSTKQIVQIRQCIALLCARFGSPVRTPEGAPTWYDFPSVTTFAQAAESGLRECKIGFRARYLRESARALANGDVDLLALHQLPTPLARERLMSLVGVGRKIADCVLLFAYGRQDAFPVDVWVRRALHNLYFPRRKPSPKKLQHFAETHFGAYAGYAQQYLFHYVRTHPSRS